MVIFADDNAYKWGESLQRMLETNTTLTDLSIASLKDNLMEETLTFVENNCLNVFVDSVFYESK